MMSTLAILFGCVAIAQAQFQVENELEFSELAPGQPFYIAFTTSNTFNIGTSVDAGGFGGLAAADLDATLYAYLGHRLPDWDGIALDETAILSADPTSAAARVNIQGPVFNTNNQLVAKDADALWSGQLVNPIDFDENSDLVPSGTQVWTGTNVNGTPSGADANGWLNPSGTATIGDATATNGNWIDAGVASASGAYHLYAISLPSDNFNAYTWDGGLYASSAIAVGTNQAGTVGTVLSTGSQTYQNRPGAAQVTFSHRDRGRNIDGELSMAHVTVRDDRGTSAGRRILPLD